MTKSVEIIAAILDCLPDRNQTASRLLFTSIVSIGKDNPNETLAYAIQGIEILPKIKHEGNTTLNTTFHIRNVYLVIFELITELFRNDPESLTPGQSSQLIQITTEDLSQNRLNLIGALCSKYETEIVDHLLSSIGPHTLR